MVVLGWPRYRRTTSPDDALSPFPVRCGSRPLRGAAQRLGWNNARGKGWEVGVMRLFLGWAKNIFLQGSCQVSGAFGGCTWQ